MSGSDKVGTLETDRLQRLGLDTFIAQHRAEDASGSRVHRLFLGHQGRRIQFWSMRRASRKPASRRAEALAAIMRGKRGIVIAGMHGKTTTSAMTAHVLREGGLHPSHYVGAEIPILGTNAHWDPRGEYFVAEGDESDGTMRFFHPEHTLLLNIEEEHLDFYADLAAIESVFAQLLDQTSGNVFYCADDANSDASLQVRASERFRTGFAENADYRGADIELQDFASVFCVFQPRRKIRRSRAQRAGSAQCAATRSA